MFYFTDHTFSPLTVGINILHTNLLRLATTRLLNPHSLFIQGTILVLMFIMTVQVSLCFNMASGEDVQ